MKLIIFAALVVVASAFETEEHKEKRQVLLPGAIGYGGYGVYPGFLGAGVYPAGFYGGYPGIIGRKRRAVEEAEVTDDSAEDKEKRQILTPFSYGLAGAAYPGYLGYGGLYPAGGFYGGYPAVIGRKRREVEDRSAEEEVAREKRQLVAGGVYPGVAGGVYPGVAGGVYPGVVGGYPLAGAPVVGAPFVGAPLAGGYGLGVGAVGLGAPVVDTGYGLPTAVVGRKRREVVASEEEVKDKRHVILPGALGLGYGYGYGYPGFLAGGVYPGFYGAGLVGGYPAAIL